VFQDVLKSSSEILSAGFLQVQERLSLFLEGLKIQNYFLAALDIVLVAILIYWVWNLIKGTRALRILYGIIFLAVLLLVGQLLHLVTLNWIMKYLLTMLVIAIPIIFQPELRAALERIGRTKLVGDFSLLPQDKAKLIITELVEGVRNLSRKHYGALIIIKRADDLGDLIHRGKKINAKISQEILEAIFEKNSPLHDGAAVVVGGRIEAAGIMIPLEEAKFDHRLGGRHQAALLVSTVTDALAIVVSEEHRTISLAAHGKLYSKTSQTLRQDLETLLIRGKK